VRVAKADDTVRDVFVRFANFGRRSAAVLLLDGEGRLAGMFTDSDLARLLERRRDDAFDGPISAVMNSAPLTVRPEATFADVVELLADRKISELPVVDDAIRPVGLIDITDVIGWLPPQSGE
jgi:arabinose-5-phosphate isomerase